MTILKISLPITVVLLLNVIVTQGKKQIYYHPMQDGTFLIAASHKFAKDENKLLQQLDKFFHIPNKNKQQHKRIDYDYYERNFDQVDVDKSSDKQTLMKLKNACLNQKQGLNGKRKLEQFKKGKCSPVVLVPGILATALILQINCQKLKSYKDGKIFKSCGWTTCLSFGISTPDEEYLLWVGLELTLKVTGGFDTCFGDLFGLLYDKNSFSNDFGTRYSFPAGLKSTWFGNTEKSSGYSQCGSNAIRDLSGHVSVLSIMGSQCALRDYGRMLDMLQVMGYDSGLTMQALPYDFRYGVLASTTPKLLPQIVNNLYYTTGKKVVIVAHSLGTLHTLTNLAFFMTDTMKQKMIRHYIPITPPWFGTVSAIRNALYGDSSYFTKGTANSGINKYGQNKFALSSGSTYDLFLRDAFKTYRNQSWMQEILKRIQYEKQGRVKNITYGENQNIENGQEDYPMNWFPSKYEKCYDEFFKKNPYCETGLIDFLKTPIFQIQGQKYYGTSEDILKILSENLPPDQATEALSIWSQTKVPTKSLNEIPSPGVNTSVIFTTVYQTQIFYSYPSRPKDDKSDYNTFILPNQIGYTPGDISVPSFSPLVFVSKWIHQQLKQKNTSTPSPLSPATPSPPSPAPPSINVIEYCSNYNRKRPYYSSLSCQCKQNPFKNQLDCTHPCIISDKYLISFVMGILTNGNQDGGYGDQSIEDAVQMDDDDIQERIRKCYNLKSNNWIKKI